MRRFMILIATLLLTTTVGAKNIDLSTVPDRDTVQLTIYNAEDLTLVRETRSITFKQGLNPLQFSWANTLIDPTSVELRFLDKPDQLTLLDTTFPHDKPQMLYWNVQSESAGPVNVEITYFTSGISWSADYTAIAATDESATRLEGYVTVTNNSGEDYENAQIRLVVGRINLVEQVAQLARQGILGAQYREEDANELVGRAEVRQRVMRKAVMAAESAMAMDAAAPAAKQIVKEGLSEYFIFTIEGTETVPNRWAKRMRSFDAADVPVKVQYRYRPREYGDQLVRMYLLTNDEKSKLGQAPLPDGVVRVFRQKDADSLAYVTTQQIQYIPIGDKIELNLGADPEVVFELITSRVFRDNIWLQLHGLNIFRRADQPGMQIDERSSVVGWDTHTVYDQRIRNYRGQPIDVEIRRAFQGDVTFVSQLNPKLHDYQTVQFSAKIDAGRTADLYYEVILKEGRNAENQRAALKPGDPSLRPQ